jgi:signal transduction histidine kinase
VVGDTLPPRCLHFAVPSTSPAAGSGLIGLIGLRDRVQALGGSIEVNSSAGEGTAILVELPLQPD